MSSPSEPLHEKCVHCREAKASHEQGKCPGKEASTSYQTAQDYIDYLPANWCEDSSLETWFPLTAEELKRTKAEKDALEGALREICEHAPEAEDFEVGGKFDYDNSCGNSDDVEYLGEAREHFRLAKIAEAALKGDKKL